MATLYLVGTPIGNLADLSRRGEEVLASVNRILAEDTRRTRKLLGHLGLSTPLVSLHAHNEEARLKSVLDWLDAEEEVALVSDAGTPVVSDPGSRVVREVRKAGHFVVPVPGPSAVTAALSASGFSGDRFTFLGFPPRKGKDREDVLERVRGSPEAVVLFESPERLVKLLADLAEACGEDRPAVVAREVTKVHEEFLAGGIRELEEHFRAHGPRGEVTLVLGPAPKREGEAREERVDERATRALASALLEEGLSPSRCAREVVRRLDVPRNRAYEIVLDVARNEE